MGFVDAVKDLAQQAGMPVPEDDALAGRARARRRSSSRSRRRSSDVLGQGGRAAIASSSRRSPRAIDYLKGRGLTGEIAARFGLGYAPEGWRGLASVFPSYDDPLLEESGLVIAQRERRRGEATRRRRRQALRPLPRPHHVPDPLRPGRGDRLRRPGARPRRAQVPELARDAGVQQGPRAVRPVRGAHRACASAATRWSSRATWTWSRWPSRASATRSRRSARPAPPSTCRSCSASPTRSSSASTATPPAGAPPAGRSRRSLPHATDTRSVPLPVPAAPSTTRTATSASSAPRRSSSASPRPCRCRSSSSRRPAKGCDLATAEGRARFLANARPLWTALPDGMLKRQLLGEIASRGGARRRRAGARCGASAARPRPAAPSRRRRAAGRSRRAAARRRRPIRQPADRVAWMLLLDSDWWEQLERRRPRSCCAPCPAGTASCSASSTAQPAEHGAAALGGAARAASPSRAAGRAAALRPGRRRGPGDRAAALERPAQRSIDATAATAPTEQARSDVRSVLGAPAAETLGRRRFDERRSRRIM